MVDAFLIDAEIIEVGPFAVGAQHRPIVDTFFFGNQIRFAGVLRPVVNGGENNDIFIAGHLNEIGVIGFNQSERVAFFIDDFFQCADLGMIVEIIHHGVHGLGDFFFGIELRFGNGVDRCIFRGLFTAPGQTKYGQYEQNQADLFYMMLPPVSGI